jgi:hypothetical protein
MILLSIINITLLALATIGWLAFTEAFLKPAAISLAYGLAPRVAAEGLAALDRLLPDLLHEGIEGEALEAEIRRRLSEATGAEWDSRRLLGLRRLFDPLALIERAARDHQAQA